LNDKPRNNSSLAQLVNMAWCQPGQHGGFSRKKKGLSLAMLIVQQDSYPKA
jgi:hypothetical protein